MIFTAIGTAIAGALFAGSAIAASVIAGGLAFGTSLLLSSLNRPKAASRPASQPYSAVQGQVQYGANVPVGAMFGTGKVKGHHVFYAKYGSGNKYNADVFLLSNGWCDGLETDIYFYGEKHTLIARAIIGNEVAHYGVDGFGDLISIRFYDGRAGQGVDTKLVSDTAALGNTWKATSVCAGIAHVVVERLYDVDKFDKGRPDFEFVLRGLREYDPRKDSTIAGGSGTHRLDNPATWQFSKNPVLHRLNYQLGIRGLISGRTLIGEGKSLGQLDLGSYFAAMNVADTLRNGKPTYQAALYVTGEDDHTEVLKELDDAIAGYALNRRGLSGVIAGAPQIPVVEITAADIPVGRGQEVQRRKSAFELYNYISGQFTSPQSNWSPESLTPVTVNLDVAADGRPRQTSNDFLQVTDADIAQYLLNIRYRQNRKGGSATVPVSRRVGLKVQEGEWVAFDGIEWLVTGWRCDAGFRCTLTLAETGADVYSEDGIEPGPIVVPPTAPINPSLLSTVQDFTAAVGFIEGTGGVEVPALQFTWTPPEDPSMTAVRFFYFVGDDPTGQTIYEDSTTDVEAGTYTTTKNIVPGVFYTARATITTVPDRLKTFTLWVTTATVTGPFNVFAGVVGFDQLTESFAEYLTRMGVNQREQFEQNQALAVLAGDQDLANASTFSEVRSETATAVGDLSASFLETITVQVVPINGRLTAIADVLTQLSAGDGVDVSTARWRMTAMDGPTGYATLQGEARVISGEDYRAVGFGADVPFDIALPARFWVDADQFVVRVGTDRETFFIVDEAGLRVRNALIANLDAGNIDVDALTASAGFFDNLEATWANIDNAVINNFVANSANIGTAAITNAKLGTAAVETLNVAAGNISTVYSSYVPGPSAAIVGTVAVTSLSVPVTFGQVAVLAFLTCKFEASTFTGAVDVNLKRNGTIVATASITVPASSNGPTSGVAVVAYNDSSAVGTNTYLLEVAEVQMQPAYSNAMITATNNKR